MGNLLTYTDKSKSIDAKMEQLLADINRDYQEGNIRTETEYYYRIKQALTEFYDSLSKPSFKYRPAVSTPMSDEYNSMIRESYNDMEYIIKDCETLTELVSQSFNDAELGRKMMQNKLNYITKKVQSIGASVSTNQPDGVVVFTELFSDNSYMGNMQDFHACMINTDLGILTMRSTMREAIFVDLIEIDPDESNGFPGNTHCVDTLNSDLHFIGQEGLHNNPGSMIDNSTDTWFEFELFNITDETRKKCNSLGFEYDEGVIWATDDKALRLKLICHLDDPHVVSWISIQPYLSDVKGIKNCYIEKAEVITTANNVYLVAQNMSLDDTLVFPFPPHEVQRVEITLRQASKYLTKVGHYYYTMADTQSMSIFQNYDYSDEFARIDGPKPHIGLIGCKYNPTTQWVEYPTNKTELPSEKYAKAGLFSLPASTVEKKSNQEMVDAYRYMIGIREITMSSHTFAKYGEYISKKFNTKEPITSIVLEADEWIPGTDAEVLRYFVSLNGGQTWHKIYPTHRAYDGIYKYYVNNDTIENNLAFDPSDKRSKNISFAGTCTSIQVKIEMDRPVSEYDAPDMHDDEMYYTFASPIVYQYKLKLTTGGETIEY